MPQAIMTTSGYFPTNLDPLWMHMLQMAASLLSVGGLSLDQIVADADETLTRLLVQRPNRYEQKQVEVRRSGVRSERLHGVKPPMRETGAQAQMCYRP